MGFVHSLSIAVIAMFMAVNDAYGQSLLHRTVTIDAEHVRLSTALERLAKEGGFKLSYNAVSVPGDSLVDLHVSEERVDRVLQTILPPSARWKESGHHVIITGTSGRKQRFIASGVVVDAATDQPIGRASMYEVSRSKVGVSDALGAFSLELTGQLERTPLLISRHGYHDTVVYVMRDGRAGRVRLRPKDRLQRLEPRCDLDRCGVEELGVARLLVPASGMDQAKNMDLTERRTYQFSLVPSIGTNGAISGSVTNRFSFNLIGGYARGLEGVELGGAVNLLRDDMKGLQIGGLGNLVGGRTRGAQIAGGLNHSMREVAGLQLAGLSNTAWDTLSGVQVAGGVNVVKRGMAGTQIAGAVNVTLGDLNGVQVSGAVNVADGVVNKTQVAGAVNYAHAVDGGQVAGGCNVARGAVKGGQVGLGGNYARSVAGGQVSFGINVCVDSVSGGQVGFAGNFARRVTGGQVSFGINVVPGPVSGGQVGTLNIARHALGGQVGIVNLSDSISGAAVGLLTIALKGYHRFDLVTGDVFPLSLQLRTGTRGFYNILGWSPSVGSDQRWGFLYGFGSSPRIGKHSQLDIELSAERILESKDPWEHLDLLGRLVLGYGHVFGERISLTAGPVLNLHFSDDVLEDRPASIERALPEQPLLDEVSGTTRMRMWPGWRVALGVKF